MKLLLLLASGCFLLGTVRSARAQDPSRYPLIPLPQSLEARDGAFTLDADTRIALSDPSDAALQDVAAFLAGLLRNASVLPLPVDDAPAQGGADNTITLRIDPSAGAGEGYRLSVTPAAVTLTAATPAGLFYGVQTLRQLLPPSVEQGLQLRDAALTLPAVDIEDAPRFGYRGLHLDVGRHFFPVSFIKRYIDLMARYKLNTFHWHLTEDQGWRIEIKQYPRLTEVGAFRDGTLVGHYSDQPHQFDGQRYGGYYTQEEVRDVVAYAQARHVTIIPEIEMPGHSVAALAAYPELACTEGPFEVGQVWGIYDDIYCPKEETFTFLENVLTEVIDLFPGPYIHIGGDEAPKTRWEASPVAQEIIQREGLQDEHELQSYFIKRIERFLNAHGRRLIGWDEILEGGLAPQATVMSWRGTEGGIQAAKQGHDVVMTPNDDLYLDHYQADPEGEPLAIGGMTTLEDVYTYEPIPEELSAAEAEHVLGAQGNVWTEYIRTPAKVEYMVFPRALALAEVVWSPKAARDWAAFKRRLAAHLRHLDALQVNYHVPDL